MYHWGNTLLLLGLTLSGIALFAPGSLGPGSWLLLHEIFAALFVLAYIWLLREARRGRARLALCADLLLLATPWLIAWYAVWAVPLAAVEEDRTARLLALGLCAYLLPNAVPL